MPHEHPAVIRRFIRFLQAFYCLFYREGGKKTDYGIIGDPAKDLIKITLDEFYETFTGTLLLLKPDARFVPGKNEKGKMFNRFLNLLLPHKKLFAYSIIASVILTVLGIVSSLFNKILMDEILPYKLKNPLLHSGSCTDRHRICPAMDDDLSLAENRHSLAARLF